MNYNEIAEAYDKVADALTLNVGAVSKGELPSNIAVDILELREKAAAARNQAEYDARNLAKDSRERVRLEHYLELEERTVAARELQASAFVRMANAYEQLRDVMKEIAGSKPVQST